MAAQVNADGMQVGYVNVDSAQIDMLLQAFATRAYVPNADGTQYTTTQCQGCTATVIGTVGTHKKYQLVGRYAATWARMVADLANRNAGGAKVAHTGRVKAAKAAAKAAAPAAPAPKYSGPVLGGTHASTAPGARVATTVDAAPAAPTTYAVHSLTKAGALSKVAQATYPTQAQADAHAAKVQATNPKMRFTVVAR